MGFENLIIKPEGGQPQIKALFNPERYTVNKSVQFAEVGIPGLDSPVLQFVRGQNEKLTLELFFDTTDYGMVDGPTDVRDYTGAVYRLMKVNTELHAPPRFKLEWGAGHQLMAYGDKTSPWCVMESVSEEFNLFSPSGVPLRAKLNVTIREAATVKLQFQEVPRHSADRSKLSVLQRGQTLSSLAWQEYGDPTQWRAIADANNVDNPRLVDPGSTLTVPSLTSRQS
jgi:hypothetical protein